MNSTISQGECLPRNFDQAQLLVKDFDGTIAQTFEKSPNGIGINEAYEVAIENVFGTYALQSYLDDGGLNNRAPSEVVQSIEPSVKGEVLDSLVEALVSAKLDILMSEIGERFPSGSIWPRPTLGYLELAERLEYYKSAGRQVDDLVLSSGHEPFIKKTYQAWNIAPPNFIVGEDTIRKLPCEVPEKQFCKPSAKLMTVAKNTWRKSYGLSELENECLEDCDRIVYVGDDIVKDGQLAKASGVRFYF